MLVRHEAAAFAGVEVGGAEAVEQCTSSGPAPRAPRPLMTRTAGARTTAGRPRSATAAGSGQKSGRCFGRNAPRAARQRHVAAQRVGRKIEIDRAGLAAFAEGPRDRLVELLQRQRRLAHGARIARDRAQELGMRHVLQGAAVLLRPRRRARRARAPAPARHGRWRCRSWRWSRRPGGDQGDAEPAVSSACACAMYTAARSSRTSTMPMPSASMRIQIGMMWPPHRAKTRSTPRAFRKRATMPAALSADGRMRLPPGRVRAPRRRVEFEFFGDRLKVSFDPTARQRFDRRGNSSAAHCPCRGSPRARPRRNPARERSDRRSATRASCNLRNRAAPPLRTCSKVTATLVGERARMRVSVSRAKTLPFAEASAQGRQHLGEAFPPNSRSISGAFSASARRDPACARKASSTGSASDVPASASVSLGSSAEERIA